MHRRKQIIACSLLGLFALMFQGTARALPLVQDEFCDTYPQSPHCRGGAKPDCGFCHTIAPDTNAFGTCVLEAIDSRGGDISTDAAIAFADIEDKDCDGDGVSTLEEILAGTFPGDPDSKPKSADGEVGRESCEELSKKSGYDLCGYDALYAFRRLHQDFCGATPDFDTLENFASLPDGARESAIADALDRCLDSEFWLGKDGVLWRIAHTKVEPLQTIKSGDDQGTIPLGDYEDDYNLFVYHQMDGRDVRGILVADYYVLRQDDPTFYVLSDEVPVHPEAGGVTRLGASLFGGVQQWVPKELRAGMLTTLWNAVSKTMFTNMPRTTAAAALRNFLDLDIAKSQGLIKPNDPNFQLVDFDSKGVTAPDCAFCHEALDAATYPFTKYNGLSFNTPGQDADIGGLFEEGGGGGINIPAFIPDALVQAFINNGDILVPGMYKARRIEILAGLFADTEPNLGGTPEQGFLLGQPVANLQQWARVAANSDYFAKATVKNYWVLLLGSDPSLDSSGEYEKLWRDLMTEDGYSVEAMLHKLVRTNAYGAP